MTGTRNTSFEASLQRLKQAKSVSQAALPHRSLARTSCSALDLVIAASTALALWAAELAAQPLVMRLWTMCIEFWLSALHFPVAAFACKDGGECIKQMLAPIGVAPPELSVLLGALGLAGVGWILCGRLEQNNLPLKYLVRALSAVLVLSVLVFFLSSDAFTYSLGEHVSDLLENSYRCLLAFPFLLGMGYYLFHERLGIKLAYSLAIGLYFLVMIPHKILLHIVILHFGTRLAMPLLYICLGSAFDVLAFIALYAWALSNLPTQRQSL